MDEPLPVEVDDVEPEEVEVVDPPEVDPEVEVPLDEDELPLVPPDDVVVVPLLVEEPDPGVSAIKNVSIRF